MFTRRQIIGLPAALTVLSVPKLGMAAKNSKQKITICLSLMPSSLDPTKTAPAVTGEVVLGNILEGLTNISESSQVEPLLAESWLVTPGHLKYRFFLKQNVYYHDGSKFDAKAVVYSFNRAKRLGNQNKLANVFHNVANIKIINTHVVEIDLKNSDPFFLFRLGQEPAVILHPNSADNTDSHPVGTGPYSFINWESNGSINLVKNKDYHGDPAHIEQVKFTFIDSPEEQIKLIKDNQVDIIFRASNYQVKNLRSNPNFEVVSGPSNGKGLLAINNNRPGLDNINIRRAITHAIDREEFIDKVFNGYANSIGSHFTPTEPDYIDLTSVYTYNPDLAKQLIEEAGLTGKLDLTISLPPTSYALEGGKVIANYLAAVGINISLQPLSWQHWLDQVFSKHQFDLSLILHVEPLDYDIYTNSDYYFGYNSEEFKQLAQQHARSVNPRQQKKLFQQIQRKLTDDAVNAWIYTPEIAAIVARGLKGVQMSYPLYKHEIRKLYWD